MLITKLIIVYILGFKCRSVYGNMTCSDCLSYKQCQNVPANLGENQLSEFYEQIFMDTYCDFEMDTFIETKVCCSEFTKKLLDLDDIEMHPNIGLLPTSCLRVREKTFATGSDAELYEFPWTAVLVIFGKFNCEATIINSRYVLTAAHCFRRRRDPPMQFIGKEHMKVRVGDYDLNTTRDCSISKSNICETHIQEISIDEIIIHEEISFSPNLVNDIGLLRLQTPIDFSFANVAPVCLPTRKELRTPLTDDELGVVTGWGFFVFKEDVAKLQKLKVPIITKDKCDNRFYSNKISVVGKLEFCVRDGYTNCISSGGPVLIKRNWKNSPVYIQYGISSRGPTDCKYNRLPEIFVNVIEYMKWILDHIKP